MAKYNKTEMYFFKFPDSFFDTDEIEELSNDYDGDSTIILYLKLITIAMNKCGYLCRLISGELKPYTIDVLAKKTNTDVGDLVRRIDRLHEVGLIDSKDGMLYIEKALNYTNQTVSAEKKQKQRKRKVDKCPPDCPPEEETRNQNLDIRNQILEERNIKEENNNCSFEQQEVVDNPALQDICSSVINYLNKKAYKNFKPDSKKTVSLIKQRLNDGYKLEDFYRVIDNKVYDWIGNVSYEEYLRPITLFGNSFKSYLYETPERIETDWRSKFIENYY